MLLTDLPQRFSHFSDEIEIVPYSVEQGHTSLKPRGLWVSVDGPDDWPTWATGEEFHFGANRFRVALEVGPLVLDTVGAITDFGAAFADPAESEFGGGIDWPRVAAQYPGIIIAPYQWALRMEMLWYYGWDCASGCIWDASVIKSVELVLPVSVTA